MVSEVSVHGWQVQTQKDDGVISPTGKLFISLGQKAEREGRSLRGRDSIPGHDPVIGLSQIGPHLPRAH